MSKEPRDASSSSKNTTRLLGEFETPSYDQWRAVAEKSLKGAPFDKKLKTETYEGLILNPVYTRDAVDRFPHMHSLPGFSPFTRGTRAAMHAQKPWDISCDFQYSQPAQLAEVIGGDLEAGLQVVGFSLDRAGLAGKDPDSVDSGEIGTDGVSLLTLAELEAILDASALPKNSVQIEAGCAGLAVAAMLTAYCRRRGIKLSELKGGILMDPLSLLSRFGKLPKATDHLFDDLANLTRWAADNAAGLDTVGLDTVGVESHCFHESGASAVEELGFALATGVDYVRELLKRGLPLGVISEHVLFSFSVGGNFFVEVAKLRAARLLWALAIGAFGGDENCQKMKLRVRTSRWTKTVYDPYVNILRSTTETFSAAIAGADSIQTGPFDEAIGEPDAFSRRIARNVQIVLQEESHLHSVIDPAGGSWYVETLTDYLASNAWKLFQDVERIGGIQGAIQSGFVREIIEKTSEKKTNDLKTRKEVIVGTNIYPNPHEQLIVKETQNTQEFARRRGAEAAKTRSLVLENLENASLRKKEPEDVLEKLASLAGEGATIGQLCEIITPDDSRSRGIEIEPLPIQRRSAMFENMRRAVHDHFRATGKRAKVFLANMGPVPTHKARADFSTGFFEVAGIEVLGNSGFDTPEKAAKAAVESGADAAVVCSTDETYPDIVPRFAAKVREKKPAMSLILAGYPKDQIEAHRASGIDEFIHIKANNFEILRTLLQKMGVAL